MEFDIEALQELVAQEEQAVGACAVSCGRSCRLTVCPATCQITND
ncbi:ALQxL family class IV lanthipeptide [Kitasatospora paranensis]|uniref:ALQxL family class IV lanthipeptide n=1 Tax=Kitasatospora paranensis TaxID=258053 RepID=A0ABW2FTY5_9ACTN